MDYSTLINIVGTIALPVLAFVITRLSGVQRELDALKLHVAENYLNKSDFNKALEKLEKSVEKIVVKLDTLAERRREDRGDQV